MVNVHIMLFFLFVCLNESVILLPVPVLEVPTTGLLFTVKVNS